MSESMGPQGIIEIGDQKFVVTTDASGTTKLANRKGITFFVSKTQDGKTHVTNFYPEAQSPKTRIVARRGSEQLDLVLPAAANMRQITQLIEEKFKLAKPAHAICEPTLPRLSHRIGRKNGRTSSPRIRRPLI